MNAPNKLDRNPNQLIVDFPAAGQHHRQADRRVRFASHATVQPITSLLDVCSKQELWYSNREVNMMRIEMIRAFCPRGSPRTLASVER